MKYRRSLVFPAGAAPPPIACSPSAASAWALSERDRDRSESTENASLQTLVAEVYSELSSHTADEEAALNQLKQRLALSPSAETETETEKKEKK